VGDDGQGVDEECSQVVDAAAHPEAVRAPVVTVVAAGTQPVGTHEPRLDPSLGRGTMICMLEAKTYVRVDEHGVLRVGDTRVSLDSVVYAFRQGHAPETIRQQYSTLSLEEVYGALAFYLANREEVDRYLERQQQAWDQFRQKADHQPPSVVERLRALRAASLAEKR
jgi:uncharacterized protein (DUF433 family)